MLGYLIIFVGLAILWVLWLLIKEYRKDRAQKADGPVVSLVLLLRARRQLTEDGLRALFSRTLGAAFDPGNEDAEEFILTLPARASISPEHGQSFMVRLSQGMFLVHSVGTPYFQNTDEIAAAVPDSRLQRVLHAHSAWLSVDALSLYPEGRDLHEAYPLIGKVIAEVVDGDVLGVMCPELQRCNELGAETVATLAGGDPLALFQEPTHAPVVSLAADDPRMLAAFDEARHRWPEFTQAFAARQDPEQPFLIKARFSEDEATEIMWVQVTTITEDAVTGTLENTPADLRNVAYGDTVTVAVDDMVDWVHPGPNNTPVGGFTLAVLQDVIEQRRGASRE